MPLRHRDYGATSLSGSPDNIRQVTRLCWRIVPPTFAGDAASRSDMVTSAILMDEDHEVRQTPLSGRLPLIVMAVLATIAAAGVIDLILDRPKSFWSLHVAFEGATVLVSLSCIVFLFLGWRRTSGDLERTEQSLAVTRRTLDEQPAERDAWRESAQGALAGLSREIDRQFERWKLTPAEREVALLLLQGHGHKQIAAITSRSERTVRQHAVSVYEKGGVSGRAELAAFFLQDLMLPPPATPPAETQAKQSAR